MKWMKAGRFSELPENSVTEAIVERQVYAICRVEGEIYALNGACIHRGGPLGQGQIHDGHVVCPFHLWEFDCRTGEYDYDPTLRADTYRVKVEGDEIFVEVP